MYTAVKEITHMLVVDHFDSDSDERKSTKSVIFWIVLMNLIFSFDSILSVSSDCPNKMVSSCVTLKLVGGAVLIGTEGSPKNVQ